MSAVANLQRRVASVGLAQAVRVIEAAARRGRTGAAAEIGGDTTLAEEPLHFVASDRMALTASDLAEIGEPHPGSPIRVTANVLGLAGTTPALPPYYSEMQLQRRRLRDRSFASFLNIFDHRALSFFYRIFRKYSWLVSFEREAVVGDDAVSRAMLALAGLGTPGSRTRLGVDDAALVPLAARLGDQRRSAASVATVLREMTGLDLRVVEAEPMWMALPAEEQTRLGARPIGRFAQLGGTDAATGLGILDAAIIGTTVLDIQHHYAVEIGPLAYAELLSFCRDDGRRRLVGEACLLAAGFEHQPLIRLGIRAGDIPPLQLGNADAPAVLGRTGWLGSPGVATRVMSDCVISIDRAAIGVGDSDCSDASGGVSRTH